MKGLLELIGFIIFLMVCFWAVDHFLGIHIDLPALLKEFVGGIKALI